MSAGAGRPTIPENIYAARAVGTRELPLATARRMLTEHQNQAIERASVRRHFQDNYQKLVWKTVGIVSVATSKKTPFSMEEQDWHFPCL